ncbi:TatD family hydrolase [Candidatus Woesearchaeota archaeon]|nr:TatD family hydrolase [Candidatus Woesearchaeota archaeon]
MPLVDVHAHLDDAQFKDDLDLVLQRAKKAGVAAIITNGVNPSSNRAVLALAKKYSIIKAALGMYPIDTLSAEHDVGGYHRPEPFDIEDELSFIRKNKNSVIAVGEIGLDDHWVKNALQEQLVAFHQQVELAKSIQKPVIVHSRAAELQAIEALESSSAKKVVMHCFGGSKQLVKRIEDNGWFLSIPPNIVRGSHFQMIVKQVSMSQLLTETDAPYLGPEKDKRNEPAFVSLTIQKIAEIKKMDPIEVENAVFKNYQNIFL